MSEVARSRYALDLDEIERQIREASSRPAAPGQAVDDPLAELARIVSADPRQRQTPSIAGAAPSYGGLPSFPAVTPRDLSNVVAREFTGARPANETAEPAVSHQSHGLENDIEQLLARTSGGQDQAAAVNPDEFAEVMRSFDRLIGEQPSSAAVQQQPVQPAFEDTRHHAQDSHAPQQRLDFDRELAEMMAPAVMAGAAATAAAQPGYHAQPAYTDQPAYAEDDAAYAAPEAPYQEPRSRKKSMMLVAAVLGVAAVGVGGALSFRGGGGIQANGQPPLIKAAEGPAKIAPANPGGADVPDQNRQILERNAPRSVTPAKVVTSEEQPLDLREAVRRETTASTSPQPSGNGPRIILSAPVQPASGNAAEPRRVKTVVIRPDAAPAAAAPMAAPPVTAAPVIAAPVMPQPVKPVETPVAAPAVPVTATPAPVAQVAKPKPKPPVVAEQRRPVAPPRASQPATSADDPIATGGTSPMSIVPTGAPKRNQRLQQQAALAPPAPAEAATQDAPRAARTTGGSFVVQLASEGSDNEARAAASRFKNRFAELGSFGSSIQQREVNGQSRYRVRFGSMSRDDANSLCSSLKGKGQACIVQPN